ncbi:MAG: 2-isopropylmalate synthase, partial [Betaproteobacteria bacterium]|nr:2-isopropylmalate synthase [Betaproteobacteria bacterium]
GTYTHPNGSKYVGNWKAGKPHGLGSARFPNKTTYVGEYVDGKREGEGVLYAADGTVQVSGA